MTKLSEKYVCIKIDFSSEEKARIYKGNRRA